MTTLNETGPNSAPMCAESGFTLIELVVVLAIIALVTAVAVPALDRARINADLDQAAAAVIAELDRARTTALRTNASQDIAPKILSNGIVTTGSVVFSFGPDGSGYGGPLTLVSGARRIAIVLDPFTGLARRHASP